MARRRSRNRRSSMRKSLDQTGFLLDNSNVYDQEIDENFIDEYLGNQTNASDPSATIKLSLTQQLNSDSEVDKSNITENWYKSKNITTPSQGAMPKPATNRILRTKRSLNNETSASDSDNQTEIIKKRRPFFGKNRKSKGESNLYENALKSDNDKTIESEPVYIGKRTSNAVDRGSISFDGKIPMKKSRLTTNASFYSHQDSNTSTDSEKPRRKKTNLFRNKNIHERKSIVYNDLIDDDDYDESFVGPSQPSRKSSNKQLSVTLNMSQEKPRFTPDIKKSFEHSRRVLDDYDKHGNKPETLEDKTTNRVSSQNSYTNVSTKRITDENNSRMKSISKSNKTNVSTSSQDISHEGHVTINTSGNNKKINADVIDETKYTMTQESTPSISDESRKSSQSFVNNISHYNTMSSSIRRESQTSQDISTTSSISEKLKESSSDSISSASSDRVEEENTQQDYEIEQVNDLITDDSEEPKYDDADDDNIQEDEDELSEDISVNSSQKNNSRMTSSSRNINQTAEEKLIEISQEQSVHESVKNQKSKSPLSSKSNDQSLDKTTPTTTNNNVSNKESTNDNKKKDSSQGREIKTPKRLKKSQQAEDSMDTPVASPRKSKNMTKRSLDLSNNSENKNKSTNEINVDDDKTSEIPRRSARLSKIAVRKSESEDDHQLSKTTRKSTRQSKSNIKETDENDETKKNNTIRYSSVRQSVNSSGGFSEKSNTKTNNDDNSDDDDNDDDDDDERIFDSTTVPSVYDTLEMNRSDSINIDSNIEDETEISKLKSPLKNESVVEKNKSIEENKKSIGNSSEPSNILVDKKRAVTPLSDDSDDKSNKSTKNNDDNVSHINEEQEEKTVDEKSVSNLQAIDDDEEEEEDSNRSAESRDDDGVEEEVEEDEDSNRSAESRGDDDVEEEVEEEEKEDDNDDDDDDETKDGDVSKPQENTTQATNENYESPSIQEETTQLIDTLESNSHISEIDNDDENKQNNSNIINEKKSNVQSINIKENTQIKDKTNVTGLIDLSNSNQHLSPLDDQTKRKSSYKPGPRSSKNISSRKPLSPVAVIQTPRSMSTPDSPKKNMTNINQTNSVIQSKSNNDDDQQSTPVATKNTTKKLIESIDQSKISQTKISSFFKPLTSTLSQNSISTEFDKKLIEAKNKLNKNEKLSVKKIINHKQNIKQINPLKQLLLAKKQLNNKNKKNKKIIDKAYLVDGKFYKVPKLPRPKHWVTDKLYKFLWNKMESKYGTSTRVKSEKFIRYLSDSVTIIQRRKEYKNYKDDLNGLMKKMATLNIIKTPFDFNHFCYDFLPYEFRVKVIPMLMPGGKTNIPFYPDKLHTPIINDKSI